MNDRTNILTAKRRLPLPDLMNRLGLGEHAKKSAACPWHEDAENSFSVFKKKDGTWAWKCFATCGKGDEITLLEKVRDISRGDAIRAYVEMAGAQATAETTSRPKERAARPKEKAARFKAFKWPQPNEPFRTRIAPTVARDRGYSLDFVIWLHNQGLIGLQDGQIAFPNRDDSGRVVSCHYKAGKKWFYEPAGLPTYPLVFGDTVTPDVYLLFESQWDAFAVADRFGLHLTDRTGLPKVAFIVTRGSTNGKLVKALVPSGNIAFAWKQNDEPKKDGKRPGDEWLKEVVDTAGVEVRWVVTPQPHKDPNDWIRAGATSEELFDAVNCAQPILPSSAAQNSESFAELAVTPSPDEPSTKIADDDVFYDIARKEYLVLDGKSARTTLGCHRRGSDGAGRRGCAGTVRGRAVNAKGR